MSKSERSVVTVTDEMVNRFLSWPLPRDFHPDCGISFDGRKDDEWNKNKTWPVGTNLLTAIQARAMLEHVLSEPGTPPRVKTAAEIRCDAKHDTSCVGAFARARPQRRNAGAKP